MTRQLRMATISPEEFAELRTHLRSATKEGVMATFRISQPSWYKLRDGKPVRQSVVDRLRARHAALQAG